MLMRWFLSVLATAVAGSAAAQTSSACPTDDWALAVQASSVTSISWRSKGLDEIVARSPGCSTFLVARAEKRLDASHELSGSEEKEAVRAALSDLNAFEKFASATPGLDAQLRQRAATQRRRATVRTFYLADIAGATEGASPDKTGLAYYRALAINLQKAWRGSTIADGYKPFVNMLSAHWNVVKNEGLGDDGKVVLYNAVCDVKRNEQIQARDVEAGPPKMLWVWMKPNGAPDCVIPNSKELSAPR